MKATLVVDGLSYEVVVDHKARTVTVDGDLFPLARDGVKILVPGRARIGEREFEYTIQELDLLAGEGGAASSGPVRIKPPMTGKLESIRVQVGQTVAKGDVLFVLEAMKMQNEVRAPGGGTVVAILAQPGATVDPGQVLLVLEAEH